MPKFPGWRTRPCGSLANPCCRKPCWPRCRRWSPFADRWPKSSGVSATGSASLGVQRQHARQILLDVLDAVFRRRMRAQEFGRTRAVRGAHLVPESHRGARVITGPGHELETDLVRLGLL